VRFCARLPVFKHLTSFFCNSEKSVRYIFIVQQITYVKYFRRAAAAGKAEEIAEPEPMRLYLCGCALERARVALARIEASTPLTARGANSPKRLVELEPDAARRGAKIS
jgi:hypothetical protein